ncbi:sodium:proton exchanger [Candidatus Woesearchaeota archaeon CG11_big_fil_rev_8_21_14_0_20_43_8]|nr:MAG: sodium:proton exchanger [Candidatus Woesearchaeota archaeon CG11_big_fil_rev_8_21_14_0_20_43_8]PIO08972.1 MAG: sodium:proton exchanger [Candidatus Woesearchaeota archaeon CG08_land_8_20_14_0_20_43_7]
MFSAIIIFIIGLVLLIKGADFLVDGASDLAKDFGVSRWVISVTIVAFGTSLPELTVSVISAINGVGDIALGNIIGSNIANIGLVLGLSALLLPIAIRGAIIKKEMLFVMISSFLIVLLPIGLFAVKTDLIARVGRIEGLVLLLVFAAFVYYIIRDAKEHAKSKKAIEKNKHPELKCSSKHLAIVMLGIAGTVVGAKFVVDSGVSIAKFLGVSEAVIALTLIAIGTSLPELVTCVVAALKKKVDIAVGTIVGSHVFNALWIIGISALIKPFSVVRSLTIDAFVMVIFSFGLLIIVLTGKKITRWHGALLLAGYLVYIGLLF